jgi:hypothetical protein
MRRPAARRFGGFRYRSQFAERQARLRLTIAAREGAFA